MLSIIILVISLIVAILSVIFAIGLQKKVDKLENQFWGKEREEISNELRSKRIIGALFTYLFWASLFFSFVSVMSIVMKEPFGDSFLIMLVVIIAMVIVYVFYKIRY